MDVHPTRVGPVVTGLLFLLVSAVGLAQDNAAEDDSRANDGEQATEAPAGNAGQDESAAEDTEDELLEDPELDVQGFDPTADDDFVPSEDIPADAPIAFPTDI